MSCNGGLMLPGLSCGIKCFLSDLVKSFDRINLFSDHFNFCPFRLTKKFILYCFD